MRHPLIVANWKMNKNISESETLIKQLLDSLKNNSKEVVICPPFTSLSKSSELLKNSNISLGAQNVHFEEEGAFTGEISPLMLKDLGCKYVIIGHSERREYFNEDDLLINRKLKSAIINDLKPILCIGETLLERESNQTKEKIKNQLEKGLTNISKEQILKLTIAYEPIWAIGTGKTATPDQAQDTHSYIRELLSKMYTPEISQEIRILYGGSAKPNNIKDLMIENDIDGVLVGGASLDGDSFSKIVYF